MSKKIIVTIINLIILCICFCNVSIAESKLVEPTEDQFFELRAVKVTNIESKDKQVIFGLMKLSLGGLMLDFLMMEHILHHLI